MFWQLEDGRDTYIFELKYSDWDKYFEKWVLDSSERLNPNKPGLETYAEHLGNWVDNAERPPTVTET